MDEVTRRAIVVGGVGTMTMATVPLGSDSATVGAEARDVDEDVEGEDRWDAYLGAGRRSELGGDLAVNDESSVDWQLDVSSPEGSPVLSDKTTFLGDGTGRLLALDSGSGSTLWATDVDGKITLAPTTDGASVVVGTANGTVAAYDAGDGSELWERRLNARASTPTIHDGVAYLGAKDGTVAAFDIDSGDVAWRTTIEVAGDDRFEHVLQLPTPVFAEDRVVVNATDLVALDPSDGSVIWTTEVVRESVGVEHVWPTIPAVTTDSVYLQLRTEIRRYDLESGVERWRTRPEFARHGAHPVSVTDDAVITAHVAGTNIWDPSRYYCLDPDDGSIRWEFEDGDAGGAMSVGETEAYALSGGDLVTLDLESGFENGRVAVDDAENVENARHVNGGPVISQGGSIVFQHGGTVYALSDDTGGSDETVEVDDGSESENESQTADDDENETGGSEPSTDEDEDAIDDDETAAEDAEDDRSLVTRTRIQLASDVAYLISAIVGAVIAIVRGRRYFDEKER